ncbi:hypothetical protein BD413DRAFT_190185 [Trametes elegans]|nr:hypothetical protein BD413DRAFT_190185 [Trametes elegans]
MIRIALKALRISSPAHRLEHAHFRPTTSPSAHRCARRNYSKPSAHESFGVARALQDADAPLTPSSTLFEREFSLADRVALVTGANGGLGLEGALAFVEAGARAVYCVDIASAPSAQWAKVRDYAARLEHKRGEGRLEYVCADVSDQEKMWTLGETIGDREGRLDICVASAGLVGDVAKSINVSAGPMEKVLGVNLCGAAYTAQAAAQQMIRFNKGGTIIVVSSIAGHGVVRALSSLPYDMAKAGVLQMARSFACELAPHGIRVNSISPGIFRTPMALPFYDAFPDVAKALEDANPMGRTAAPHEVRGVLSWLASDASSFCTGTDIRIDGGHRAW